MTLLSIKLEDVPQCTKPEPDSELEDGEIPPYALERSFSAS